MSFQVTQSVVKGRFGKRATGEMLEYLKAEQREKSRMKRKLNKEKSDTAYLENSIKQRISKVRIYIGMYLYTRLSTTVHAQGSNI